MGKFEMKIEKRIGKRTYEFTVGGTNLHEAVMESKKLSFYDVHKCGCCGSDDLILDAHVAQEKFYYTTVKCNSCKASVNFGQQVKNPDIFYIRTRDKVDGTGKEADWRLSEQAQNIQQQQVQQPQQQAVQQVTNYQTTGTPGTPGNQPRQ